MDLKNLLLTFFEDKVSNNEYYDDLKVSTLASHLIREIEDKSKNNNPVLEE